MTSPFLSWFVVFICTACPFSPFRFTERRRAAIPWGVVFRGDPKGAGCFLPQGGPEARERKGKTASVAASTDGNKTNGRRRNGGFKKRTAKPTKQDGTYEHNPAPFGGTAQLFNDEQREQRERESGSGSSRNRRAIVLCASRCARCPAPRRGDGETTPMRCAIGKARCGGGRPAPPLPH